MQSRSSSLFTTAIATAMFALATGAASAQVADPKINAHQQNQNARIKQGVASGELTKPEAKKLHTEQNAIRAEEKAFKSDGKLTRAERKQIKHDQAHASNDIKKQKHDAQKQAVITPVAPTAVPTVQGSAK